MDYKKKIKIIDGYYYINNNKNNFFIKLCGRFYCSSVNITNVEKSIMYRIDTLCF